MVVVVNMVCLPGATEPPNWVQPLFFEWAQRQPAIQFVWLCSSPVAVAMPLPNVQIRPCTLTASFVLGWKYWYRYRLPQLLTQYRAQAVVQATGLCSSRCTLPQYVLLDAWLADTLTQPVHRANEFLQQQLHYTLKKAAHVFALTHYSKQLLLQHKPSIARKLTAINPRMLAVYKPLAWAAQQQVQAQYSGEMAYWLYRGPADIQVVTHLLKAYTQFKLWQKSSMPLLLALSSLPDAAFSQSLATYKYRQQVVVLPQLSHAALAPLMAAAYACFCPATVGMSLLDVLHAMACHVPVIATQMPANTALLQDAALLLPLGDVVQLTAAMNSLFKDEALRKQYLLKGAQLAAGYQLVDAVEILHSKLLSEQASADAGASLPLK
jgi:glycosyltransferase involved in cell wall biosynthesis